MSPPPPERPTILVVDDDEALRELLCIVLHDAGYAPHPATDGADALRQLDAGLAPVLITLDLRMPGLDGPGFLAAYKRRPQPHAPVLIVTAIAQNGHSISREVAGVLSKPFALEDLLARVRTLAPLPLGTQSSSSSAG